MQLGDCLEKTEVNKAHHRGLNCIGITASLHLQQKCNKKHIKNRMCKWALKSTSVPWISYHVHIHNYYVNQELLYFCHG